MKQLIIISLFICVAFGFQESTNHEIPEGFVNVKEIIPDIDVQLRYYGTQNFVGDTINGYSANTLFLTRPAAEALKKVQDDLQRENLCLLVYDGYRPQRAVNHFIAWAKDLNDTVMKSQYYPNVKKQYLFREEYIATRSGHSRGSTVDLTIIDGNTNEPLDMGSPYDFFGPESWVNNQNLTETQLKNRQLLQNVMKSHNFRNYPKEWWHFTLRWEPFPKTYYDFEIK